MRNHTNGLDSWKSVTFDEFLFQDREKSTSKKSKSQFKLNDIDTVTDYILGKNRSRSKVKDVKVITGKEVMTQHCLFFMDVFLSKEELKKRVFSESN